MLRCGHCGHAMVPRSGAPERYICRGRVEQGPDYCPQTPIPRASLDTTAFEYFREVGLSIEDSERQLEALADGRRREALLLREDAEHERSRTEARLRRIRDDYLDERLTPAIYEELRGELEDELRATIAREALAIKRLEEIEAAVGAGQAKARLAARLAALQAAVAGEVLNAEGVEAVRAALSRLFAGFEVARVDRGDDPLLSEALRAARDEAFAEIDEEQLQAGCWVVVPSMRPDALEGIEQALLGREALVVTGNNDQDGLASWSLWRPFTARRL
jgi:hypothetical protein